MSQQANQLDVVFVYNANGDWASRAFDFGHKIVSPKTYRCDLCKLTHGAVFETKPWARFRQQSGINMRFFHKDEFEAQTDQRFTYPVILLKKGDYEEFVSAETLSQLKDIQQLIALLGESIK